MQTAKLDRNKVLTGFTRKPGVKGIEVPEDCDLDPGKYFWDVKKKMFVPLEKDDMK
jgi:hypothetical protein|tara:strand:- start:1808 stop:1975 length:168 start_codon:yes stop_codon:yes gene_type:complete